MKSNKYSDLIKFGLKPSTLMTLSESDINQLHKSLVKKRNISEQPQPQITNKTVQQILLPPGAGTTIGNYSVENEAGKTKIVKTGGEVGEGRKKKKKNNPWSICHSELGPKKTAKFERCVRDVKKSIKEGKNYFDIILERKIVSLLETHLSPKMTKGDLVRLLEAKKQKMKKPIGKIGSFGVKNEDSDVETKPKTKPKTPETKPKPKHPAINPRPTVKPDERPKAKKSSFNENELAEPITKPKPKEPQTIPTKPPKPKHPAINPRPTVKPDERPKATKDPEEYKSLIKNTIMNIIKKGK